MSCVRTNGKLSPELPRFFDPCFLWAESDGSARPGVGPCRGRGGGTSETRAGAVLRLFVVQGMMLVASARGIKGAYRSTGFRFFRCRLMRIRNIFSGRTAAFIYGIAVGG